VDVETERRRKDGDLVAVSISVSPVRDGGNRIVGIAMIARDIRARKAMEAEREQLLDRERAARVEAETASRAKDVFLATISHELRTPLSPILAWARLLRDGKLDDAKARRAFASIERSAKSQAQLIEGLLDVARIVAGKLPLHVRPVRLPAVIEAALDAVRPAAEAKGIRLQAMLEDAAGDVAGDPERLQQVIWNLLFNAVKFTPKDGRVQVALERIDGQMEIAVSDTGQGIAADFLPHVSSASASRDRRHAHARRPRSRPGDRPSHRRAPRRLGARRESRPGPRATFTVKLPLLVLARKSGDGMHRIPDMALPLDGQGYPSLEGRAVLVVDDEPDSNEVVSTLLGTLGADVRTAMSAGQALEIVDRWKPDIVVTDIGMPGDDGYALLRKLRSRPGDVALVPVVALTAYATPRIG